MNLVQGRKNEPILMGGRIHPRLDMLPCWVFLNKHRCGELPMGPMGFPIGNYDLHMVLFVFTDTCYPAR